MFLLIDSPRPLGAVSRLLTIVAVVLATNIFTGCMLFAHVPKDLDFARTRVSEGAHFRATIHPQGDSIPRGRLQRWTLHLETMSGRAIDSAVISIDGGMPQHGHGLPTKPRVTRALGNGDYVIDGMKFNMGGWWVVKFRVSSALGADSLIFNLKL